MDALPLCLVYVNRINTERIFRERQQGASMQVNPKVKKPLLLLCFIGFTAGILLSVQTEEVKPEAESVPVENQQEATSNIATSAKEPLWLKYMPKTSVEKRDAVRTNRQNELAGMIATMHGVKKAIVVLPDDSKQGIGQPHREMSACVMVEPTSGPLTASTLTAIRMVVSDATSGLQAKNVNVINTTLGVVSIGVPSLSTPALSATEIRARVEDSIGLAFATISVTMQRVNSITEFIPWMDEATPAIRISLPQAWIDNRSLQVGSKEVALGAIKNLVHEVAPEAAIEIIEVAGISPSPLLPETDASYAKQIVLLGGIFAVLLSGFATDRKRRKEEVVVVRSAGTPVEEANEILQMEHSLARCAIDSLEGVRKIEVLRAILLTDESAQDMPVVEVAKGKQFELTECG